VGALQIRIERPEKCMYCNECVNVSKTFKLNPEDESVVSVKPSDDSFVFNVEVWRTGAGAGGQAPVMNSCADVGGSSGRRQEP
jgi:hypothetical protein